MIPVKPTSVKYPPEMRERINENAGLMSYTFGNYQRECTTIVDKMVESPVFEWPPMVIALKIARNLPIEGLTPPINGADVSATETPKPAKADEQK